MFTLIFIGVAGLYVGWNIGANDTANCIGTAVGAGLIKYRVAVVLVALSMVLGASLQGHYVIHTVGKGIVTEPLGPLGVVTALIASGFFVTAATFMKIPVSTSQAIVGGVAGLGVAAGLTVDWSKFLTIVECWVVTPILTALMCATIYVAVVIVVRKQKNQLLWRKVLTSILVFSGCYTAYSLGANDVGNSIGPIASLEWINMRLLALLGGIAMALGALTYGKGVTETVGRSITTLDLPGALSAQLSMALGVHLFTVFGIPVSTSQAIVGAVLGVGLVHGTRTVSRRKVAEIAIGWVAVPSGAGFVSFLLYKLVSLIAL